MTSPAVGLEQIRMVGRAALLRALGPAGLSRFLQQFETGDGDYSQDRHQWIDSRDIDMAIANLRER